MKILTKSDFLHYLLLAPSEVLNRQITHGVYGEMDLIQYIRSIVGHFIHRHRGKVSSFGLGPYNQT